MNEYFLLTHIREYSNFNEAKCSEINQYKHVIYPILTLNFIFISSYQEELFNSNLFRNILLDTILFRKKINVSYFPVGIFSCLHQLINQCLLISKKSFIVNLNWIGV